jgi:hypothetical protein
MLGILYSDKKRKLIMARRPTATKLAMWQADPHCYWCGRLTVIYNEYPNGKVIPGDAATIDHVYPTNDPRRQEFKAKRIPSPVVLACNKCNWERGSKKLELMEEEFDKPERTFWTIEKLIEVVGYDGYKYGGIKTKATKSKTRKSKIKNIPPTPTTKVVDSISLGEVYTDSQWGDCTVMKFKRKGNKQFHVILKNGNKTVNVKMSTFKERFTKKE